jgi:hypothetical protein
MKIRASPRYKPHVEVAPVETLDSYPRQRPDVAARVIDGEAVVVTPADSLVHELDPVATFVWERCTGEQQGRALVAALVAAFEVTPAEAGADLAKLLETFAARGLVDLAAAPVAVGSPPTP